MRYLVGIHCCQWPNCDFCISHGSEATTLRWGGQNYRHLRQERSRHSYSMYIFYPAKLTSTVTALTPSGTTW